MSAFGDLHELPGVAIWQGIDGRLVEGERVTLAVIELEPGAVARMHQHPHEQVGVLLEGSLTFTIGEEVRELRRGGAWRILAETPHEAVAGPDGAVLVEDFSPVRDDWRALAAVERGWRWPPA